MITTTHMMFGGGIVALLFIGIAVLPSTKQIVRESYIQATPEEVYKRISTTEGFQSFNPFKDTDPALKIEPFGPASGIGAGFSFEGKEGSGTQTIIAQQKNQSVTMQIDLGFMGKPKQTLSIQPNGEGTMMTWQVDMTFGVNPMGRMFGLFADKVLGKVYERGLINLDNTFSVQS